jgi:alkanesulfonate monooxygenase SsuD/methylene tetrahydromethanopterin reductase-like flavin-dependent oxidoreductase (luciferase family)
VGAVRVGVELGAPGADPGGWLAEATAYEAAGVDSLWVRGGGDDDPWVLLGALAAVTWRVRLAAPAAAAAPGAETVARLSGGRLLTVLVDAGAAVEAAATADAVERWLRAAPAPGRRAWAEALAAARDADGLLVPATPGLLDLLRNPEDEDDRGDLRLTYG